VIEVKRSIAALLLIVLICGMVAVPAAADDASKEGIEGGADTEVNLRLVLVPEFPAIAVPVGLLIGLGYIVSVVRGRKEE